MNLLKITLKPTYLYTATSSEWSFETSSSNAETPVTSSLYSTLSQPQTQCKVLNILDNIPWHSTHGRSSNFLPKRPTKTSWNIGSLQSEFSFELKIIHYPLSQVHNWRTEKRMQYLSSIITRNEWFSFITSQWSTFVLLFTYSVATILEH